MPSYTIRSARMIDGLPINEEVTTTASLHHAVLLCSALEQSRWYRVELDDERGLIWATYVKYGPENFPGIAADLRDLPGYGEWAN